MFKQVKHAGCSGSSVGLYLLCSLLTIFAAVAGAQQTPPSQDIVISGHVTDSTGALIPGAHVELRPAGDETGLSTITDSAGRYDFLGTASGIYVVIVDAGGFSTFQSETVSVESGKTHTLDIHLTVAQQLQRIDVASDSSSDTDPNNNSTAFDLKGRALEDLPLDPGQLSEQLNALAGSNSPALRINGFSGGQLPPRNSIREVRINQNPYSAQNDTNPVDGMIEIFTKPGGDAFHGQFYLYGSDSSFNSLSPFVTQAPAYHSFNFYGNLGGPINKHTSFFSTGSSSSNDSNSVVNAQTLDAATLLPMSFTQAVTSPSSNNGFSTRIDTSAGKKSTLAFNYTWNRSHQTNGGVGNLSLADQGFTSATTSQVLQVSNSLVINAKVVNDTRFQYIRTRLDQTSNSSTPSVVVQAAFNDGGNNLGNFRDNQDQYELQNYVSASVGKHFLTFGGRLRVGRDANRSEANYNGQFVFANLTIPTDLGSTPLSSVSSYQFTLQNLKNCALKLPSCLTDAGAIRNAGGGPSQYTQTVGTPNVTVTLADAGLFFQDDWKARPNLTVSAGLRYESQNHISDHADWAPRLGFAYGFGAPKGKPQTYTLRGSGGLFYKRFASSDVLLAERQNGVTQQQYVVNTPIAFTNPATKPDLTDGTLVPSATFQISPDFRAPYYLSSTVSLQRSLGSFGTVAATYLVNRGVHSQLTRNINAPLPGTYNPNAPESGTRPLGGNQNIYQYESAGVYNSNRFSANYFLSLKSKLLLYGYYVLRNDKSDTDGSFPSNQYDLGADYGRSSADTRQAFWFGGNATLPWDIQPAVFIIVNSGAPFNIVVGQDLNGDSQFNDRPAFATDLSRASVVKTKYGTFDTDPIAGQRIIPRNYGQGFGQLSVNLSFRKGFNFGPELPAPKPAPGAKPAHSARRYNVSLYIFAENALNSVNLAPPVGTLNSPLFGRSVALVGSQSSSANRTVTLDMAFRF